VSNVIDLVLPELKALVRSSITNGFSTEEKLYSRHHLLTQLSVNAVSNFWAQDPLSRTMGGTALKVPA
jgi:hypothetical protein